MATIVSPAVNGTARTKEPESTTWPASSGTPKSWSLFASHAIEIVDSRYVRRGPTPLVDSISDAASCGLVVLGGRPRRLTDVDLRRVGATLSINGTLEESGVAAAVMGNPVNSVAWLANKLHDFGVPLEAGHVVLSGSFVRAVPFTAGDTIVAIFDHFGEVTFAAE